MHHILHRLFHPLWLQARQRTLIKILRTKAQALDPLPPADVSANQAEQAWLRFRRETRHYILTADPRYFLRWPTILHTMFFTGSEVELTALRQSPQWQRWQEVIRENSAGFPLHYTHYPASSGNLIHHVYFIHEILESLQLDVKQLASIVEFGGGYGSLVRACYRTGFTGKYVIFDLPEFLLLQEYFLHSVCLEQSIPWDTSTFARTNFITNLESLKANSAPDLFVAAWSLSESSLDVRENICTAVHTPAHIAIAFQHQFRDIDNLSYFKKFAQSRSNYTWTFKTMEHLPGNSFLFGKRRA